MVRTRLLLLLAGALLTPHRVSATTVTDVCDLLTAATCTVTRTHDVTSGSSLDFGTLDVVFQQRGTWNLLPAVPPELGGSLTVLARSLTLQPGARLLAGAGGAGSAGGTVAISTTGDVLVQASGNTKGRIDLAAAGQGGTLTVAAGGNIVIAGVLTSEASAGDGGSVTLNAGGSVSLAVNGLLDVHAGRDSRGGSVNLDAIAGIVLNDEIDATGGTGGTITLQSDGSISTFPTSMLRVSSTSLEYGDGGDINILGGGTVSLGGPILGESTGGTFAGSGGVGGSLTVQATTVKLSAPVTMYGAPPDGEGGDIDIETAQDLEQTGPIDAHGRGADTSSNFVQLTAGSALTVGPINMSAGTFGAGEVDASAGTTVTIVGEVNADATGGGGIIAISGLNVVVRASVHATALNSTSSGGEIDLSGCTIDLQPAARVSTAGPSGLNSVLASGRLSIATGAMLIAGQQNDLQFRNPALPPSIAPGATITPATVPVLNGSLPPCADAPPCGNGVPSPGEQCDDGNTTACDGCSVTCRLEECGNGTIECAEQCDDGNSVEGDGCDSNCTPTRCGNGIRTGTEECDDGNLASGDGCDSNCTITRCGNGVVTAGEQCDDGVLNGDPCGALCRLPGCGDGAVQSGEECDHGFLSNGKPGDSCDSNCTLARCGNGVVGAGEQCDDGNLTDGDGCDSNCTVTRCGNHIITAGEQCDDGNLISGDNCDANCTRTGCGNGLVTTGEECDDGNSADGDGCDSNCTRTRCGNHIITAGEQCDDGNLIDGDGCDRNCTTTRCGNGVASGLEQCDDGNLVDGDGCDHDCTLTGCGNRILTAGEQCDDGNRTDCDLCSATCHREGCGNGTVECGEQCDDGGPSARCDATCHLMPLVNCGDGIRQPQFSEECDTGPNNVDCDADHCSHTCQVEACGNNVVECTEQCDDGNRVNGDGCDNNCTLTGCGNGILTAGEECDDGNLVDSDGCDSNCKQTRCGNGVKIPPEGCDDGNLDDGDCCDSSCHIPVSCPAGCGSSCFCTRDTDCDRDGRCGGKQCVSGACVSVAPPSCEDGRPDTRDRCVLDGNGAPQCQHLCLNNAACDDHDRCDGDETCAAGTCVPGTTLVCNDHDPCTDDRCDPAQGCVYASRTGFPGTDCQLDAIAGALDHAQAQDIAAPVRKKVGQLMTSVRRRLGVAKAAAAAGNKGREKKTLRSIGAQLKALEKLIGTAQVRNKITTDLADVLAHGASGAGDQVGKLLADLTP